MLGKKVLEQNGGESINVQSLSQGNYVIQILAGENTYREKFIKQ